MLGMPSADDFCICALHLEGEEVSGSLKRKPDVALGAHGESHTLDIVNYSHPRGSKRAALARVVSLPFITEEEEDEVKEDAATTEIAPVLAR